MSMSPLSPHRALTASDLRRVAAAWWIFLVAGIISVAFGIVVLRVQWGVTSLAYVVGAYFIFMGVVHAVTPPADGGPRSWTLGGGTLRILAGIAVLVWPSISLLVLATFIGAFVLVAGILEIIGALSNVGTLEMVTAFEVRRLPERVARSEAQRRVTVDDVELDDEMDGGDTAVDPA
jgi:uncharacterized membrane protein HdeD (DUF308 family)